LLYFAALGLLIRSTMTAVDDSPLGLFSVDLYARTGVATSCLTLQDHVNADVCMILCLLWLAQHRRALDRRDIDVLEGLTAPWNKTIVRPLRTVRRALKKSNRLLDNVATHDALKDLKKLELETEMLQLKRLYDDGKVMHWGQHSDSISAAAQRNLNTYSELLSTTFPRSDVDLLIAATLASEADQLG